MTLFARVAEFVTGASADASLPEAGRARAGKYQSPVVDWSLLVRQVQAGDTPGLDHLYQLFARGIRIHMCRQLGPHELDDKVHDTFLLIVHAIRKGDLREPERLMGFVRTIVRRQVAVYIAENMNKRREQVDVDASSRVRDSSRDPEQSAISNENTLVIEEVLGRMGDRDREILTRFYLCEQSAEEICSQMDLSESQFRLLKSRAKARFGEIGKKNLQQRALGALFMRTSASASH